MDMASYKRIARNRVHVLVVAWVLCLQSAHAVFCPMSVFKIKHGDFSLKAGNSVATFTCNSGFTLLGQKQIVCYGSQWSYDPPICIASTCPKIAESGTLRIKELYDGAMMKFSCTVMNRLEGVDTLICDGSNWNARTPSCKAWDPPTECDFEDAELCGWSHHDEDDQEWIWHTGATKTTRTGPSHDHTLGNNGAGHYMYFETSSPTRTGHEAWFSSPLYPIHYSHNYCFTFWYHSFGADAMGILEVFIKPELADLKAVEPVFYVNTSMGNEWQRIFMPISKQTQPFQIVFVATRGSGYRSDYAIDDVTLSRCVDKTTPANGPESTPNLTTAFPSLPSVPNVSQQPRTARTSTSHMAVSEVPMTTISRTSRVTGSDAPRTTISRTSRVTGSDAPRTTISRTSLVTSPVQTTEATKTTLPATQQSTDISRQETSSVTLTDHTSQILTGYQQTSDTQGTLGTHDRESAGTDRDMAVETYILIGLGVGIIMIVAIVIGCLVYRKKYKFVWTNESSASTENPLYSFLMDGDKDAEFAKSQY